MGLVSLPKGLTHRWNCLLYKLNVIDAVVLEIHVTECSLDLGVLTLSNCEQSISFVQKVLGLKSTLPEQLELTETGDSSSCSVWQSQHKLCLWAAGTQTRCF